MALDIEFPQTNFFLSLLYLVISLTKSRPVFDYHTRCFCMCLIVSWVLVVGMLWPFCPPVRKIAHLPKYWFRLFALPHFHLPIRFIVLTSMVIFWSPFVSTSLDIIIPATSATSTTSPTQINTSWQSALLRIEVVNHCLLSLLSIKVVPSQQRHWTTRSTCRKSVILHHSKTKK